jgi:7,8-dihydroneopterin aldolase/epimerase/oxygenase
MSLGTIRIEALHVDCIIGILDSERVTPQRLLVDVELETDFAAAAASDDVADTVNYAEVAESLTRLAVQGRFRLVERFVSDACSGLLESQPRLQRVRITARKPDILPNTQSVGVSLELRR